MIDEPPHQRREKRDENVSSENNHSQSPEEHTNAAASEESLLSPSVVFGLLADERCRYVLSYLDAQNGHADARALVNHVAAREHDTSVELLTEEMTERVSTELHHKDLPRLADHGLIENDFQRGTVTLTDTADDVAHYLEFAAQLDDETPLGDPNRERSKAAEDDDG